MSVELALARIAEIQRAFAPPQPAAPSSTGTGGASFAGALGQATATLPTSQAAAPGAAGGGAAAKIVAMAAAEVGVREQPPGSNDSPRIAQYRTATSGSGVGPWCAYFTSWLAKEAGVPVGEAGQGFGLVDALRGWAERTGKTSKTPQPGDFVVWDEHIGVVERVDPDGKIHTIEGNSSDAVTRRTYGPDGGGAITYIRLDAASPAPAPVPTAPYMPSAPVSASPTAGATIV